MQGLDTSLELGLDSSQLTTLEGQQGRYQIPWREEAAERVTASSWSHEQVDEQQSSNQPQSHCCWHTGKAAPHSWGAMRGLREHEERHLRSCWCPCPC